ncbi:MAG TPA: RNA polymerase sigma factor RpoD/SigA [Rectinema sp.]|jgi:RNA polymerase primary sigma factor|nr:RNA polymerase sigma factor RpoD/SigA [Spirochaetia bacterium]MDI9427008.1 RNA polymerase sigma factor RpoD/SigA [Spirochaetota bacterium]NLH90061.1 RNA polymerase sigma factor RpoD/SigA [Treponema sp.]OQC75253.1 MAG: RNA polymerase sigma factor SigA [Spirochaetes bacterium ADurb.Bin001]HNP93156.1 RNA polymerase sigma factor RpoD/SigA [Rectinema sp.]
MVQNKKLKETRSSAHYDDENVLSMYLREINRIPLLSREEENDFATRAAAGDEKAKEILAKSNLRFVVNVAKKYQNQGLPLADLIAEGNIGLLSAIDHYDVTKGYHFISYAVWWIRQAILKAICEKSRMIRLPLNRANELVQIEKARSLFEGEISEEDEIREVARFLNMEPEHIKDIISISRDLISLDAPVYDERNSTTVGELIENEKHESPEQNAIQSSLRDDINEVLSTLTAKEREIVEYRFGLNGKRPMSLKEIGDRMHLTKERIRQIEKAALKKVAVPETMEMLQDYVA